MDQAENPSGKQEENRDKQTKSPKLASGACEHVQQQRRLVVQQASLLCQKSRPEGMAGVCMELKQVVAAHTS